MILGPRIAAARKAKDLTQKELAEKLGLATGTVQQYELGKRRPDVDALRQIAALLEVSVDALVGTAEPEDEYELICDVLGSAGIHVAPSGYNRGDGPDGDTFFVAHEEDPDDPDARQEIKYARLAEIVHKVLADAETNKNAYIQKRLEAELFGWKM